VVLTKFFYMILIVKVIYPGTKDRFYVRVECGVVFRCCVLSLSGFSCRDTRAAILLIPRLILHIVITVNTPDPAYCYFKHGEARRYLGRGTI